MTYEECAAAGMSVAETARATGKPRSTISAYAKRIGLIFAKGRVSSEIFSNRMKALNADPEFAERRSNRMKALHADPEFAARHREASSARMKALNADPEFAERRSNRMKALHADPEFAERRSNRMKALHADPEFAERRSNRMKALHADPEFAARHREASSARMKALNADPARNPLVLLTPQERTDYNTLKKAGHPRADALRAIGRADLVAK